MIESCFFPNAKNSKDQRKRPEIPLRKDRVLPYDVMKSQKWYRGEKSGKNLETNFRQDLFPRWRDADGGRPDRQQQHEARQNDRLPQLNLPVGSDGLCVGSIILYSAGA